MSLIDQLVEILDPSQVLTGADCSRFASDWTGVYRGAPLAVVRPSSTEEVSATVKLAVAAGVPIVPVSGNTGLAGGTKADGALVVSLERMNAIREIRPDARVAIVEAGVVLDTLHAATADHGLTFPLAFGARGSCMIGGNLATNAGGSNVLRYGSTRSLCLGLEVVLPTGEVLDLMSALHKDNTGYDLKDLFVGAEGTLGIITAATLKLVPRPRAYATAMVATNTLGEALSLLNRLQETTGGAVEAYEYMPGNTVARMLAALPHLRAPFDAPRAINILLEVGASAPRDVTPEADGSLPIVNILQECLVEGMEAGEVLDAVVARSESHRAAMWALREANAEVALARKPAINADVSVPLDLVEGFIDQIGPRLQRIDEAVEAHVVCHLGDGNVHYTAYPGSDDPSLVDRLTEEIEAFVEELGGSFSAEHGIGIAKLPSMRRRKDPVALQVMRQVKAALDPKGLMNPGKVLPNA